MTRGFGQRPDIQDHKAGSPQTQTFTYDELDRLKSAGAAGGTGGTYATESYTYSATGNLLTKGSRTLTYPASTPGGCTSGTDSTKPHAVASADSGSCIRGGRLDVRAAARH